MIQRVILAASPAVVASDLMKSKNFDDVINDETSIITALEMLQHIRMAFNRDGDTHW